MGYKGQRDHPKLRQEDAYTRLYYTSANKLQFGEPNTRLSQETNSIKSLDINWAAYIYKS